MASFLVQLVIAAFLGGLVGIERERNRHPAGVRTYSLVAMGSCAFTILSLYGFGGAAVGDPARVAAQIVVGVGFLGAGIIFKRDNSVAGLTTAAGVWVAASVGMAVATGFFAMAIAIAVMTMIIFFVNDNLFQKKNEAGEDK